MRRARIGLLVVSALALAVVACGGGGEDESTGAGEDPGLIHVHGLGVNPGDGRVYAGTHHGVFRVDGAGKATRVSERRYDTMGFTVIGPDHFLGSGHPDPVSMRDEDLPPLLGLTESNDGGRTWRPKSLLGKVDFHALAAVHDRIYGYDSTGQGFMVSKDGREWETRSHQPLVAFAVDPGDADHIVATTSGTLTDWILLTSTDGGRSWRSPSGVPELVYLSWHAVTGLWGIGPDGEVHHSTDGGSTWHAAGKVPGAPEALLATKDALYAAAGPGIYRSDDDGQSWQIEYRKPRS